jgi:hypothetical protein
MKFKDYVEKRDLLEANWWEDDKETLGKIKEIISDVVMQSGKTPDEYKKITESLYKLLYSFYRSTKIIKEKESKDSSFSTLKKDGLLDMTKDLENNKNIKKAIMSKLNNSDIMYKIEREIITAVEKEIENENMSDAKRFADGKDQSNNAFR